MRVPGIHSMFNRWSECVFGARLVSMKLPFGAESIQTLLCTVLWPSPLLVDPSDAFITPRDDR